jgi:hypothetical protein
MMVQVTLHETAHLLAARAVGFSPISLTVGGGPLLFQGRMGGVHFRFHWLPLWGLVKAMPVLGGLRWKGPIFSSAGLLMDALLLAITFHLAAASTHFALLAGYQVFIIAVTLWPMDARIEGSVMPNDGKELLRYLTGRTPGFVRAYEEKVRRYDASFLIGQSWLMRGEAAMTSREFAAAEADIASGRYADAVCKYSGILEHAGLHVAERALVLDAMASIPVVHGDRRFLAPAEGWARQASGLFPQSATVRGTLGSILVEKGASAEGLELLMPLTSEDNAPLDRTLASCYAAKAFHALGDAVRARKWLQAARSRGMAPQVCARIEAELAAPSAGAA